MGSGNNLNIVKYNTSKSPFNSNMIVGEQSYRQLNSFKNHKDIEFDFKIRRVFQTKQSKDLRSNEH